MGMYDEIYCETPLPDGAEAGEITFQTKSFPDACGARYTITRDGRVIDALGADMEVDGYIEFYTNSEGWRCYCAFFRDGILKEIEAVNEPANVGWHLGIARCRLSQAPSSLFEPPERGGKER